MKWPDRLPQADLLTELTLAYIAGIIITTTTDLPLAFCRWAALFTPLAALVAYFCQARRLRRLLILIFFLAIGAGQGAISSRPPQAADHIFTLITKPQDAVLIGQVAVMPSFDGRISQTEIDLRSLRRADSRQFQPAQGRILLSLNGPWPTCYPPGTVLAIRAELQRPAGFITPGTFDYPAYLGRKGIWIIGKIRASSLLAAVDSQQSFFAQLPYLPEKIRTRIATFLDASLPAETSSLYRGVLIGDSSGTSATTLEYFKASGTMHILAISGSHLALIGLMLFALFSWMLRRSEYLLLATNVKKIAGLLCLPILILYSLLAGMNSPVLRSCLMVSIAILAFCTDRRKAIMPMLSLAALLILLADPQALFTASLQLSFMAIIAMAMCASPLQRLLMTNVDPELERNWLQGMGKRLANWLLAALLVSVAATAGTAPIVIYYFNRLPLYGPLATVVVEPLICYWSLVCGFIALPLLPIFPEVAAALVKFGAVGLDLAVKVAAFFAQIPGQSLWLPTPPISLLLCSYLFAGLTLLRWRRNQDGCWTWLALSLVMLVGYVAPPGQIFGDRGGERIKLTCIDVGQGSANLLELPSGEKILIDGGGSPFGKESVGSRIIAPFLWQKGITRLDMIIITHPDADHYNGLPFVVSQFAPKQIWVASLTGHDRGYKNLIRLAREQHSQIHLAASGDSRQFGQVDLRCIANIAAGTSPGETERNSGLVIQLIAPQARFLFPGDIDQAMEADLISGHADIASTILVAAHHGSPTSNSPAFLTAVGPRALLVSAGRGRGPFPHQGLVDYCRARSLPLLVTADHGSLSVHATASGIEVRGQPDSSADPLRRRGAEVVLVGGDGG